ncbi:MAG: lipopolysaccharide biosynthesis protein [Dehalococcoidia bacterium]
MNPGTIVHRLVPAALRSSAGDALGGLLKLGIWGAADQAVLSISNFVTLILVARAVGPKEFGNYSLALTFVLFAMSIQAALLNKPYVVLSAARQTEAATREYVTSVLWGQVAFSIIVNAAAVPAAYIAYLHGRSELSGLLVMAGLVVFAWGLQEYIRQVLYVERRMKDAVLNDVISYFGQLFLVLLAWKLGVLTPVLAFGLIALTSFVATVYGLKQIRHSIQPRVSLRAFWSDGVENWRFGRWMLGAAILLGTVDLAYVWLVAGFVSVAAAGALRAVTAVMGPTHILLKTMDSTLTPIAARTAQREGAPGIRRLVFRMFLVTGAPMLGWCVFVSVSSGRLLDFLYGSEYAAYAWLLPLGALSYAIGYSNRVIGIALVGRQVPQALFHSQVAQSVFFWTIGLAATYQFGLEGAALTMVGASFTQALVLFRAYRSDTKPDNRLSVTEMMLAFRTNTGGLQ